MNCGSRQLCVLGTDDQVSFRVKDREYVIAKTVFRNGHLAGQPEGIRTALVIDFRVERAEKCGGEFRKIRVSAWNGALPKNEIGEKRQRNQHDRKHGGVTEREAEANRIKHGSSGRK